MCCHSYGVANQLPRTKTPLPFFYLYSNRPEYPTHFISFKTKPGPAVLRCSLNDTVLVQSAISFYELLGIPDTGSFIEIKQAYKQLARKYHPDVSPPGRVEEYTQTFIQVHEAYETLSDPRRRKLYDRDLLKGFHPSGRARFDETAEKSKWKSRWESQLSGLKRRSVYNESTSGNNMSWGARMRRERNEPSS